MEIFIELTGIVLIATICAVVMKLLRQPLIVGYILAGIIAGPYVLNLIHSTESIELFSKIGITVLLFIVGLSLSPKVIKDVGKVSLVTGLGQVIFTSVIGFAIALLLGIDRIAALYISIALTFSSTIIILKLLSDKGDVHKLYGKISIGFLLVQDIVATIILLLVSSLAGSTEVNIGQALLFLFVKAIGVGIVIFIISTYIVPKISKFVASSAELLFLFSLTWGLGFAALFYLLGLSIEIGALVAGVMLSVTPFSYEIGSRLKPLRDFFIVLFFVLLGSQMVISNVENLIIPAVVLSAFVLIGNPIIVVVLMNLMGYKRKTGFLAGLTVAQISEFSLILAALGFSVGHLNQEMLSLITLVGLITIAGSTYFILYSDKLYALTQDGLRLLELKKSKSNALVPEDEEYDAVLFGYDRVGSDFVQLFKKLDMEYVVIDNNPDAIKKLEDSHIHHKFGDASDTEFLEELKLSSVELVISTIPDHKTNVFLAQKIKQRHKRTLFVTISRDAKEAKELYDVGADYVILPHYLGASFAVDLLSKRGVNADSLKSERRKHQEYISKRLQ